MSLRHDDERTFRTHVVAAALLDDPHRPQRLIAAQRAYPESLRGLWELPGGKQEPGETVQEALHRECREELAIILSVGEVFMDVTHEYPDLTVHLTLLNASIADGVPQKLEHNDIRWITVKEIPEYAFCPADEVILRSLQSEH